MWCRPSRSFFKRCILADRKVRIDPFVYPVWAFLVLAVPFRALCGWLVAALCHEMGHIIAQYAFGGRMRGIHIHPMGAVIEGEDLGACGNIICVLAGPAAGAVPMMLMRSFPECAIFSFLLTMYNLIPLYPLDGGRALHLLGEKSCVMRVLSVLAGSAVLCILICAAFWWHTSVPLIPVIPYVREKFLAKRSNSGYNRATTEVR